MKTNLIFNSILLFVFLIIVLPMAFSQHIESVSISDANLSPNERLQVSATVVNPLGAELTLQSMIVGAHLPTGTHNINLNETNKEVNLYDFTIGSEYGNGDYNIIVRLIPKYSGEEVVVGEYDSKIVSFSVHGAPDNFKIRGLVCADLNCALEQKVFDLGSTAYFDFESSAANTAADAAILFPDGSLKSIVLPFSLKLGQVGAYELKITGESKGHNDEIDVADFAVIEKGIFSETPISQVNAPIESKPNTTIESNSVFTKPIQGIMDYRIIFIIAIICAIIAFILGPVRWSKKRQFEP